MPRPTFTALVLPPQGQLPPLLLPRAASPAPSHSQMATVLPEPSSRPLSPQRILEGVADSTHGLGVVGQQVAGSSGAASPPARPPRTAAVQVRVAGCVSGPHSMDSCVALALYRSCSFPITISLTLLLLVLAETQAAAYQLPEPTKTESAKLQHKGRLML